MPRAPKDPKLRQRRNKEVTAQSFVDTSPLASGELPDLPDREDGPWNPRVLKWWREIWESPMSTEYTQADIQGLENLMDMQHRYMANPTTALAAEIRLQRQCYGLTPIDRRRLQWEIRRIDPNEVPKATPRKPKRQEDPRAVIKAVS